VVFEMEDAELRIGERDLLRDAELWLERGEHVSLIGPNGSGKTTLISALVGARELDAGKLRRGHNVKLGLLSQHAEELDSTATVLEAAQRATKLTPPKARALLGQFMFSGEAAEKPVDGLSGGERRRLSLAILVHSGANVLILDEPTNHLDLESREALEAALQGFQGAVLLISHDRALLDAVGSRTIAVEDKALRSYVGGWAEYLRVREERVQDERTAKRAKPKPATAPAPRASSGPSKNQRRQAERLEREIEQAEAGLKALEEELADPSAWSSPDRTAKSTRRHDAAKRRLKDLYEQWEAVASAGTERIVP
jgi:ATP-binding cassette subfamily F protein 3